MLIDMRAPRVAAAAGFFAASGFCLGASASGSFDIDGDYFPIGVNLGAVVNDEDETSVVLGGEASLVTYTRDNLWLGVVTDGAWAFDHDAFRHRVALEAGGLFFGVEAGFIGEQRGDHYRGGFTTRLIGSVGIPSVYFGYAHLPKGGPSQHLFELGFLLKYPIQIDD